MDGMILCSGSSEVRISCCCMNIILEDSDETEGMMIVDRARRMEFNVTGKASRAKPAAPLLSTTQYKRPVNTPGYIA